MTWIQEVNKNDEQACILYQMLVELDEKKDANAINVIQRWLAELEESPAGKLIALIDDNLALIDDNLVYQRLRDGEWQDKPDGIILGGQFYPAPPGMKPKLIYELP